MIFDILLNAVYYLLAYPLTFIPFGDIPAFFQTALVVVFKYAMMLDHIIPVGLLFTVFALIIGLQITVTLFNLVMRIIALIRGGGYYQTTNNTQLNVL